MRALRRGNVYMAARRPESAWKTMANPLPASAATPSSNGRPKNSKEAVSGRRRLPPQSWWLIPVVVITANYVLTRVFFAEPSSITIPYTFFKQQVEAGNVEAVSSEGDSIVGSFKTAVTYPPPKLQASPVNAAASPPSGQLKALTSIRFKTQRPIFADQELGRLLEKKSVVIEAVDENGSSWFKLLVGFGPTLLLIAAFIWISRRAAMSGGGLFGLGRSQAKRYTEEQPKVTFDDVARIDEAENELIEIVDFLKIPPNISGLAEPCRKEFCWSVRREPVRRSWRGRLLVRRACPSLASVPLSSSR
jgi:cell division protease FtsH